MEEQRQYTDDVGDEVGGKEVYEGGERAKRVAEGLRIG